MRRIIKILGVLLVGAGASLVIVRGVWQRQTAHRIKIDSAAGISSLEKVRVGGIDQWISIRGWNREHPLLLLLHGGPGFPGMPFAHVTAELEKHLVVVRWDQRGAGKSYSSSIPERSMNIDQFVADTVELTDLLRQRFNKPRILLGAHSWGTMIGALTVAKSPERFSAYLSVCQAANAAESERLMYRGALEKARAAGNDRAVSELTALGMPPYNEFRAYDRMTEWISRFSNAEHPPVSRGHFVRLALESPLYSWGDLVRIPLGAKFSFSQLWREAFYETDLFMQVPRIDVPVFFFLGRHDHTVTASAALAERYFAALEAPRGKQLIWFENSGHWPHLEEPERFEQAVIEAAGAALP